MEDTPEDSVYIKSKKITDAMCQVAELNATMQSGKVLELGDEATLAVFTFLHGVDKVLQGIQDNMPAVLNDGMDPLEQSHVINMLVMLYLQRFFSSMVEGIALVKPDLAVDSTWPCYTWQTTQFIQGEED